MPSDPHPTIDRDRLTRWYNAQARFYGARRNDFEGGHVRAVAGRLDAAAEQRILDAGCGTGLFAVGLAALSPRWRVDGVDRAAGMLDVGRREAGERGLDNVVFSTGDVDALAFDDAAFDAVVAAGLLPNLDDFGPALAEFRRVLRPGGRLFLVEVDREALSIRDRLVFRTMVWGYRAISSLLPRYKFARGWSLERSTLAVDDVREAVRRAGLDCAETRRAAKHFIVEAVRPN